MTTSDRHKNNELLFHQKIQSQLFQVRALLKVPCSGYSPPNHQRSPVYFADYPKHTYQDKFGLAEFLTNVAIASQMNILDALGVDEEKFRLMHRIVNGISSENGENSKDAYAYCNRLILRFVAEENCVKIEQDDPPLVDEVEPITPGKSTRRKSTDGLREGPFFGKKRALSVKELKEENRWKITVDYSINVIATSSRSLDIGAVGQKDPLPILLKSRTAETILHTLVNAPRPLQAKVVRNPIDFDLTWLFKNISSDDFSCNFAIDQSQKSCYTPRRNRDVDAAVKYFSELEGWCHDICTYFLKGTCWNVDAGVKRPNLDSIDADVVFVPVLPIFEPPSSALLRRNDKGHGEIKSLSPLLPIDDIRLFLSEQCRTLDEKIQDLVSNFPPADPMNTPNTNTPSAEAALLSLFSGAPSSLITSAEATLFLLFTHSASITEYYIDSLQAIEQATVEALDKACGREVSLRGFGRFVRSKLFSNKIHSPKPFNVDIRRPHLVPEGIMRIEMSRNVGTLTFDSEETWPIQTITKEVTPSAGSDGEEKDIQINIPSIASMAKISGKSFVHGWLTHQFVGRRDFQYQLRTISRQFSNFMVLTGTISHHQRMDVKNAMIIQNKDEVVIPLNLCRARAVGDFSGLVSSLSPQQQSFAQSAREVQLESSVFAVCVVEIKPQLEVLLGLPSNSLTKEVKLVSTLLSLFVDHEISSDLLSYEGPANASVQEMIDEVKAHVEVALEMVHNIPGEDMDEAQSAELSAEDMVEDPRFQRGTIVKDPSVRGDREKISASASDDNTSIADLFRKKRSNDTIDPNTMMDELAMRDATDQFIIDPFLKSMRRVPSVDYMESMGGNREANCEMVDISRKLNAKLKSHTSLQPTAVETGDVWVQKKSSNPRGPAKDIGSTDQEANTKKAMNLLDALSRSGSLPIQFAEVHAIVGVTHCFQNTLMDTLVLENVDPIKQLTESTLLLASVIHDTPLDSFVNKT